MRRPVNRITPVGGPELYDTFRVQAPLATHYRVATCDEIECDAHIHGWVTEIDLGTRMGVDQADYIRTQSGRRFIETRTPTGMARFTFEPWQRCFAADRHAVPLEREPLFTRLRGDRRWYGARRVFDRAEQWVDEFAEHQQTIKQQREG